MGDPPTKRRASGEGGTRRDASKKSKENGLDNWPTEKYVTMVKENDVLLGRGAPVIQNVGNSRYRALVQTRKGEYGHAQRHSEKDIIAREIVREVIKRDGKFLHRVATLAERKKLGAPEDIAAVWSVVDFPSALEKTKQTLREKNYSRASDEEPPTPSAAVRMPQPNYMGVGGLSSSAGLGSGGLALGASADHMALLMMQRNQNMMQYPGSFDQQQLLVQHLMMQQQPPMNPFAAQALLHQPPSMHEQMTMHQMLQRHNMARANHAQQQVALSSLQGQSLQARFLLEQELLARTEAGNASMASYLGLPSLQRYQQEQQFAAAAASLGMGPSSSLSPPVGPLGAAATSRSPHTNATASERNAGIDPSAIGRQHQEERIRSPPRPKSTVSAAPATSSTSATEGQVVEEQKQGKEEPAEGHPTKNGTTGHESATPSAMEQQVEEKKQDPEDCATQDPTKKRTAWDESSSSSRTESVNVDVENGDEEV